MHNKALRKLVNWDILFSLFDLNLLLVRNVDGGDGCPLGAPSRCHLKALPWSNAQGVVSGQPWKDGSEGWNQQKWKQTYPSSHNHGLTWPMAKL